jgi:hypothetical protein
MRENVEGRRALLAAGDGERRELQGLFSSGPLREWDVVEANDPQRARFLRRLNVWDAILLGGGLPGDLMWVAGRPAYPVLLVADLAPEAVVAALQQGVHGWLPRDIVLANPGLLAAALERLCDFGDLNIKCTAHEESLRASRRQVDRLADLLWDCFPGQASGLWLSERHILERLEEEVIRSRRHGTPLSIILGEVSSAEVDLGNAQQASKWVAYNVCRGKRRSDVAGQYARDGLLVVLPQTPQAGAEQCCRRLRALLDFRDDPGSLPPMKTCLVCASLSSQASTVTRLLSQAEQRLHWAGEEAALVSTGARRQTGQGTSPPAVQ